MSVWIPRHPFQWLRIGCVAVVLALAAAVACTNLDDLTEPDCAFTVAPMAITVGNQGGSGTLAVRAPGVCAWTVENESGWVSLSGERSGKGDGNVGYAVAAHQGFDYRYATLTVAGKSVTVSQAGQPLPPPPPTGPVCSYSVSPGAMSPPATGGPGSVAVAAPAGCAWTATSQAAWITITSGANGSGSGAFGYNVAANTGAGSRTGSMSAGGQTISVTQAGTGNCAFTVSPTSATFNAPGGAGSVTVTTEAGCAWTARSEDSWIVIAAGASGSGNGTVSYLVAPKTNKGDRDGRLTVAGRRVDIKQHGTD